MKKFNVTGLCIPEKHYMADISSKVKQIVQMVEEGLYFTINRPRQYGKTTVMLEISKALSAKYDVIKTSFEGVGDDMFKNEELFCKTVFNVFARSVRFTNKVLYEKLKEYCDLTTNFNEFSDNITKLIEDSDKDMVLIIDEVDKSSGSRIFMQFLGVLRNKYLAMNSGEDLTFQSVILGGVNDIKNIKLSIREEKDRVFNSPWNVAADFKVDMSLSAEEIETMLKDYVKETGIKMDTKSIACEIRKMTNGYPYLVSRLCKNIDEYLNKNWTFKGLEEAVKLTLNEQNTLFDDVIKNIENNEDLKSVVYEILIEGRDVTYNPFAFLQGIMYGILSVRNGKLVLHNRIVETLIYEYLTAKQDIRRMSSAAVGIDKKELISGSKLHMEKVLLKFQEFMYQEYRQEDEKFYETNARLIFLAYLKPILNGKGFYFVEPQTRENKRMDIVITFGEEKFIVELKIWNGQKYEEKGIAELTEYLEIQNLDKGYMLIFSFNKNKKYLSEWIQAGEKKIFEVLL